jgi:acyl CoA:acetate/3-ketoacid CoA transferase alpha subunit
MASAADVTFVEAERLVEIGGIDPNHVVTPGIFVNYIVEAM